MNLALIGAGELGSRHLQGLMRLTEDKQIYVLDPFRASVERAVARASEVGDTACITAGTDSSILPAELDVAILAMNADHRLSALRLLTSCTKVKHIVLEKVLFQRLADFDEAAELIAASGATCHVNHPRRMATPYQELHRELRNAQKVDVHVTGGNWGLGCNALHLLDVIEFLSHSPVTEISFAGLDRVVQQAKRPGFVEFTGILTGRTAKGSFSLTAIDGSESPLTTTVLTPTSQHTFHSVPGQVVTRRAANGWATETVPFRFPYQSELSGVLADELIRTGHCALPEYGPSATLHRTFISGLLNYYRTLTGSDTDTLPIT